MKRCTAFLLMFLVLFALSSCLTVESDITIRNDGSGTLRLSYRISRMVQEIGRVDTENTLIPLPVNEEDFTRVAEGIDGATLRDFSLSSDEEYIFIEAEIDFIDAGTLSHLLGGNEGEDITFTVEDGVYSLTQRIYPGLREPISEDSLALLNTYFSEDVISLTVRTESAITDAGVGRISDNGTTALYSAPIADIVQSTEPVVFEVTW